jgi:hypothetical protein
MALFEKNLKGQKSDSTNKDHRIHSNLEHLGLLMKELKYAKAIDLIFDSVYYQTNEVKIWHYPWNN